jgi:hypothetical protein
VAAVDTLQEALAPIADAQTEGGAFFDFRVEGRWGGTISGDEISADLGTCRCGQSGPSVFPDIVRYANLADGDKTTCAGTMDAYARSFVGE